jgi:hypothetical protein
MSASMMAEFFRGLAEVVASETVRMSGAWAGKPQRRYASPEQSGTGEGPFVETVDWSWEGTFDGTSPLVGLALLVTDQHFYWVKSHPPAEHPEVGFSAHGWARRPGSVSVTGSCHGAYLPSVPVEIHEEPPAACVIGQSAVKVGTPHVVMQVKGVAFAVVVLAPRVRHQGRSQSPLAPARGHRRRAPATPSSPSDARPVRQSRRADLASECPNHMPHTGHALRGVHDPARNKAV